MKKILVINFFPAFVPPKSGGELRYFNMYKNLSRYYDVTLLSPTYNDAKEEVIVHSETLREYRVPKEDVHNRLHWSIAEENICPEISALVCSLSAKYSTRYHRVYQNLYPNADIIIHEFPYMLGYDLYFGLDDKPRFYNSHNYESNLVSQMWKGPNADKYISIIRDQERFLVEHCDAVFATSEEEREAFARDFQVSKDKIFLAPNGIDISEYERLRRDRVQAERKKAFFIGSAHPPNMEAVDFITETLAPNCPEVDFYIAGKCCNNRVSDRKNVFLMGLIDEKQKDELFATADVAVNPMFSGAGTNLKTLEFLSAGIPMISTYVGVRGLNLEDQIQYVHAEKDDFAEKLLAMLQDKEKMEKISKVGKEFINAQYSWEKICDDVQQVIERYSNDKKAEKPLIFTLNDYEVHNPFSGGEVRIYNLLKSLSQYYRVVYLSLNYDEVKKIQVSENFYCISVPKTEEHKKYEEKVNRMHWISSNDIVAGKMIAKNELFMQISQILSSLGEITILQQPYLVDAVKPWPTKVVIYDSQNFEYALKKEGLKGHPLYDQLIEETKRQETATLELADAVVCCSSDEVEPIKEFSPKPEANYFVVRNGVEIEEPKYDYAQLKNLFNNRPILVFVGSGHGPNVDAAAFIIRGLSKQLPQCDFVIIGSVCDAFQAEQLEDNVLLMHKLPAEYKSFLLFAADVALNPVDQGAGSNLKLAEYFAYGIPTVTTPFGARGYHVRNGVDAVICEREDFAGEILKLLQNPNREAMTENAYQYAKAELSWNVLGEQYAAVLDSILGKKKLLVLTYRHNEPPRGGAEVFMDNVLRRIAAHGNYAIDVVTTDIGDIYNTFRFSCDYSKDDRKGGMTESGIAVKKFPVDVLSTAERWKNSKIIYDAFNAEGICMARQMVKYYQHPLLMGGWYFPEIREDGTWIWSAGVAEVFIAGAKEVILSGIKKDKGFITLKVDSQIVYKKEHRGHFSIYVDKMNGQILTIETKPFTVENQDPRSLGICVSDIRVKMANGDQSLDLKMDYKQFLRQDHEEALIDMLIENAKSRPSEVDKLFQKTRGPMSPALEQWLDLNMDRYDVVLGHSTPFNTLVVAQEKATEHHKPCVLLPHFHMEDDFYHWNSFYSAFSNADCVIAAPNASKELFFDKVCRNAKALPGGGVEPSEFQSIDVSAFKKKYPDTRPFVLVLGRKAGAKNYKWVIEAIDELNSKGTEIRLLIVGRDDDGVPINSPNVVYLGEQSRQVVLGALKCCEFVVNMSGSESFGIVILESWLAGKTVIANKRCVAFEELIDEGVNGVLATREELSQAIKALMNNPIRIKMADAGRKKAEAYSWEMLSNEVESIFDELVNEKA